VNTRLAPWAALAEQFPQNLRPGNCRDAANTFPELQASERVPLGAWRGALLRLPSSPRRAAGPAEPVHPDWTLEDDSNQQMAEINWPEIGPLSSDDLLAIGGQPAALPGRHHLASCLAHSLRCFRANSAGQRQGPGSSPTATGIWLAKSRIPLYNDPAFAQALLDNCRAPPSKL